MALGCSQHFVSAQYLVKEYMKFWSNFVYAGIETRCRLVLIHFNFRKCRPWLLSELCSRLTSYEQINEIWSDFAYAFILIRSRLGLLCVNFRKYTTELWPLVSVKISFPFNVLWTYWWNLTKFCIHVCIDDVTRSRLGWLRVNFANIQQSYGPWVLSRFRFRFKSFL